MTKEITKANILQQIQDKFSLREFTPSPFLFEETVVPVYNIESHLGDWEIQTETIPITSAAPFLFFTVPEDERWTLRAYLMLFLGAGAITVSGLYILRDPLAPGDYIYLDLTVAQTVSYIVNMPVPVVLHPKTEIYLMVDGYTSAQSFRVKLDVLKEKIR